MTPFFSIIYLFILITWTHYVYLFLDNIVMRVYVCSHSVKVRFNYITCFCSMVLPFLVFVNIWNERSYSQRQLINIPPLINILTNNNRSSSHDNIFFLLVFFFNYYVYLFLDNIVMRVYVCVNIKKKKSVNISHFGVYLFGQLC
jgi:hypothetical protein